MNMDPYKLLLLYSTQNNLAIEKRKLISSDPNVFGLFRKHSIDFLEKLKEENPFYLELDKDLYFKVEISNPVFSIKFKNNKKTQWELTLDLNRNEIYIEFIEPNLLIEENYLFDYIKQPYNCKLRKLFEISEEIVYPIRAGDFLVSGIWSYEFAKEINKEDFISFVEKEAYKKIWDILHTKKEIIIIFSNGATLKLNNKSLSIIGQKKIKLSQK